MRAIQIEEFGGPEVMRLTDLPDPQAGDGEVVLEVSRAGINFADTHVTRDDYLAKQELPLVPGGEVAGRTPDGRRVAALLANGGYAEKVAVDERFLVPIPDEVSDDAAAGLLLQGLTAHSVLGMCARLEPGESVVIQAAAGGTGSLAVQLAKRMGAGRVIALASSEPKRELARRLGADAVVDSRDDDLEAAMLEANEGAPVDVVLEMTGGESFEAGLRALAPFGRLVAYGNASRTPVAVRNVDLMRTSRSILGFWLVHLFRRPQRLREAIVELLGAVAAGDLEVVIGDVYPMSEAGRAHEDIAARRTHGKLLLDPSR